MADLQTTYLGLTLRNPVVVSSCGYSGTLKSVRRCAEYGAGAVVLKSLFEEQINAELGGDTGIAGTAFEEEARRWLSEMSFSTGPREYLELIKDAKRETDIPIIASINGVTARGWTEYSRRIEDAGADALELNIALMPLSVTETSAEIERDLTQIVAAVRKETSLPIAVKIGPWFSALPRTVTDLIAAGANGVVLFNRFYQMDIDPVDLKPVPGYQYSSPQELPLPLRWIAILSPQISCDYSLSTGVHSGEDAAKALVAGARIVQVASALYLNKLSHLQTMIRDLDQWLDTQGYASADAARGRLASAGTYQPRELERVQYVQALSGIS